MQNTPLLLVILDGWGIAPKSRGNAIAQAHTPTFDHLIKNYWVQVLQASGESVGLPWGEMGNSEVGHLSLGAGKTIYQDLPRITRSISDGSFSRNKKIIKALDYVKTNKSTLHLIGLVSDGGVHSHIEHLEAILEVASLNGIDNVLVHCFLDGRDVGYNTAKEYITDLEDYISKIKLKARIASIAGRYLAMDRDNRWDRTAAVYNAIVYNKADKTFVSANKAIDAYYKQEIFDEQIPATIIGKPQQMGKQDAIIFFNYRSDRIRQITESFVLPDFNKFNRKEYLKDVFVVTMTEYDKDLPVEIAFPPEKITKPLAKVLSDAGVNQLHMAETEKYAHVTFFFNGGREEAFPKEDRILIPSPQQVASYDQVPEMSASELNSRAVREINTGKCDFIILNFANSDMVAHTGNLKATIKAVEFLDKCLKELVYAVLAINGTVIITSDHGNGESLFNDQSGEINKEHTVNPVPCVIVGKIFKQPKNVIPNLSAYTPQGVLADVAPTILRILGLPKPKEMSGRSLV